MSMIKLILFKIAVTHYGISETPVRRVEKIAKFCICQTHIGNALWVHLVYVRCASLYVAKSQCAFGVKHLLNMPKNFLEARRVSGVCLICFE